MAPKSGRGRSKGEKKKKEEKILPVVMDVTVNLADETSVVLKVRGPRLKDAVDVAALKPCTLTLVEEEYDKESAAAHVRRLLDIVACTTSFGPSADDAQNVRSAQDKSASGKKSGEKNEAPRPPPEGSAGKSSSKDDVSMLIDGEGETNSLCPKLGSFYEFFSLSHLSPPIQFIRRASRQSDDQILEDDHLFFLDVKLCNGKLVLVEACKRGFISVGKHRILSHNLVDLLRQLSRAFDNAYDDLMKAFSERNKFGNLPYGFRANTWLIPPAAAQSPSIFPPLPVEDESWGGNGGGWGRDGKYDLIPWANEFKFVASMHCKTPEERQIRDRKAFLIHSLFVDVAIFRAFSTLRHVMEEMNLTPTIVNDGILHTEKVGDLNITVIKDASLASSKIDTKIDGLRATALDQRTLTERNLLKGITADENTAAHDISSLGFVNLRYAGYIVTVKVEAKDDKPVDSLSPTINAFDQPEGGANALNINSLRLLLHKESSPDNQKVVMQSDLSESKRLGESQMFVQKLLEESLAKLQEEDLKQDNFVRWELGACWLQHLQDQKNSEKDKKPSIQKAKNEMKVEGLGSPLRSLKNKKPVGMSQVASDSSRSNSNGTDPLPSSAETQPGTSPSDNELALKSILSDAAFTRLKDSDTGLHQKSLQELIDLSQKYYDEVALPKLVKLSEKLSHVQSLCIHEMIVRAYKHILQAAIASVSIKDVAVTVAAALNLMLGAPESGNSDQSLHVHPLARKWLELFLMKRYQWDISGFNFKDLRKFAILRGLCQKVGIELVPRDYDMGSPNPFRKTDVVSLIPVHKALAKLVAVCGPYHRMTAGAYSLLAVVLYHTGDFNQSYGDLAVFYYRLQHTELALQVCEACTVSVASYVVDHLIQILLLRILMWTMMEEGLGNTAASYHAIAIALSLMEAYPLSVQHEQTTLQILRAKLGPDDLRTQDAAAWLEYFESKAVEQQEAARNGTRKPDASIASKGHLSVSDLLDYINPSPDAKGRTSMAVKRKISLLKISQSERCITYGDTTVGKVQEKANQNPSTPSPEGSPKDPSATASIEEEQADEPEEVVEDACEPHLRADEGKAESSTKRVEPVGPALELVGQEQPATTAKFSSEINPEGEDEWLPVQRPRSAGGYGRRVRQRRAAIGKLYGYQKKEVLVESDHAKLNNSLQRTGYYVLRQRQLSAGSYTDQQTVKSASQVSKFGRRIVKTMAYRVKSVPSSVKGEQNDAGREGESVPSQEKTSIVRLGKSPSYKDVALAPPGSITKLQGNICENDVQTDSDVAAERYQDTVASNLSENVASEATEMGVDNVKEINECFSSVPKELFPVQQGIEENQSNGVTTNNDSSVMAAITADRAECDAIDIHEVIPESTSINSGTSPIISSTDANFEEVVAHSSEQEHNPIQSEREENLEDKPMVMNLGDTRDFPSKKLSASAPPFKPSPAIAYAAPRPLSVNPSGPGASPSVGPWPVNMTLHHGHAAVMTAVHPLHPSPHHGYPSPPGTPHIIRPVPFMYPPYSQVQPIPPTSFPPSGNHFHRSHYGWQCVNHNSLEFISSTAWHGCQPVEFSVIPPVAEPVVEPVLDHKAQSPSSENTPSLAPVLPDDIGTGVVAKKEVVLSVTKAEQNADGSSWIVMENEKKKGDPNSCDRSKESAPLYGDKTEEKSGDGDEVTRPSHHLEDKERTLSILVRGKKHRKHALRVPISLLRRPHCSQSFKVAYSRVVRESETPKSVPLSSCETNIAT
ncbi:hypothetical protein Cgig2_030384 [Carnegiea gigantea]|uniref:Clu domain-containing protein n=1 Tax=Carnegiea gigantea TaxID=171969 RepID=A0A9Q1KJH2_9CARY|nr:hypothetical protein Cgig2_030384 [Carnegiea gigantea]